ncbi:hypothetical protein MASR2M78_35180 [Treponema sp.]
MLRVMSFYMDQISEHQRDLTNSASQRFVADYVAGFCQALSRMTEVISGLGVDRGRLLANLRGGSEVGVIGGVMAEPAYILLAESGISDAHEVIRRITLQAENERFPSLPRLPRMPIPASLNHSVSLRLIAKTEDALDFFGKPERYRGLAAEKARSIASKYRTLMADARS